MTVVHVVGSLKGAQKAADGTVKLDLPGNPTMRLLRTGLAARIADAAPDVPLLQGITRLYVARGVRSRRR